MKTGDNTVSKIKVCCALTGALALVCSRIPDMFPESV